MLGQVRHHQSQTQEERNEITLFCWRSWKANHLQPFFSVFTWLRKNNSFYLQFCFI